VVNQEELKMEIAKMTEGADMLSVETRADYEALIKHENTAVAIKKQVEEYWNPPIAKANALHKELTGKRAEMLKPLEAFISACRKAGGAFLALEQKREQDRLDAIRNQAAASMVDTSLIPSTAAKVSAGAGRSLVETWTYEVVDEAAVPAAYKVLDLAKIKKQVQLTKDKTNIPGIRPYKTTETRRTGRGHDAD